MKQTQARVLIVEDNHAHKELIVRGMRKIEKEVDHVVDGEAALDYLFRRGAYTGLSESPLPDLVILDLRIPKVDGLKVLKEIKESDRLKHIPVVIFSSSESKRDVELAYLYGVNSYLIKTADPDDFLRQIGSIEDYWLRENRDAAK